MTTNTEKLRQIINRKNTEKIKAKITKKHFINIAKIIDENGSFEFGKKEIFVNALSDYFKSKNRNFDKTRFHDACFKNINRQYDSIKLNKTIKVLQSKVKTYEADIVEANRKKLRSKLRSSNDLDKSKSLW